jgi:hypothetical protein
MRLLLSFLFCLCGLVSLYAQTEAKHPMTKQTNPPDANPQYFPVGLFSKYPPLSEWRARWYAGELRDLEEPPLRRGKITSGTVYRFLLIPPFTPRLVVRLTVNPDGTGNLIAKLGTRRSRGGETTPTQQALSLTPDQVNKFLNLIREAAYPRVFLTGYYALRGNCYTWGSGGVCAWNRARAVQCELYRLACTRQLELIRKRKLGKLTTRHFLSHVQHELPVFLIGLA